MATPASVVLNRVIKGLRKATIPDLLTTALTNSPTDKTVHFAGFLNGWAAGTRVEMGTELMLCTEADPISKTATVVRGWLDTEIAAHALDSPIFLSPRFLRSDVMDLVNDCLLDLFGRDLYATDTFEFEYDPTLIGYGLPADAVKVIRVDAELDFHTRFWEPVHDWYHIDTANTTDFPNGKALMFRVAIPNGALVRVQYAKMFTTIDDEADDLEVAGLRSYMMDLPYYFAMNRLLVDEERHRSQIEAAQNHQRAQDTPPFLALRTGEWYQARYDDRVRSALQVLRSEVRQVIGTGYGS